MADDSSLASLKRLVDRAMAAGLAMLALTGVTVVYAVVCPINASAGVTNVVSRQPVKPLDGTDRNLTGLLTTMAGRALIKPSQVQAAVKDTGLADRLLKQLKLQGVVQMGPETVAYVHIEKQGTKSVRRGEKLLDFVVKNIETGRVTLSLEGVEVLLEH